MELLATTSLWCPMNPAISPGWRTWERNTVAWMERFRLDSEQLEAGRLRCITAGELAGRTVLHSADATGPQFATDSLLWLFAFDDAYCDEGRYSHHPAEMAILIAEMDRIVETGRTTSASPCARALADLRQRLDDIASPVQISRWVQSMRGYLGYQVWEAGYRQLGIMPSIDQYAVARIRNGSMEVCAMTVDIAGGYEVPPAEMERPDVRALTEITCCLVGLDNDIASYHKEHERGNCRLNLVDVIAYERRQAPGEALPEAVAFRDAILARYLGLTREVEPIVSEATRRYISGLSAWIRGNLDWSMHTRRYRGAGVETIRVVDVPHREVADFSPPAGIAWWWSQEWPETVTEFAAPSPRVFERPGSVEDGVA